MKRKPTPPKNQRQAPSPPHSEPQAAPPSELPATPLALPAGNSAAFWRVFIIGLVCLFIYAPASHSGWSWDDDIEITRNAVLPSPTGLLTIWSGPVGADYLPVKSTVQWLLWRLFGMEPAGYHLVNVALHFANALLLWRLFSRLKLRHAWIGGLLFVAHPVFVDSVMWVAELKNTLSLALLLGAMLAWLGFEKRGKRWDYFRMILLYLAALLSKSAVVMFPAVILLYAWWKRGKIGHRAIAASLPCFALSLAIGLLTIWTQVQFAIRNTPASVGSLGAHVAFTGLAVTFYLGKLLLPIRLLPIYPRWHIDPPSVAQFLPLLGLAALLAWCWTKSSSWGRHILFGLGFFLLNALPVLGFLKMSFMRVTWVSDHLIYLPAIGIIGLATAAAGQWYDQASPKFRPFVLGAEAMAVALLALASWSYAPNFTDQERLWNYTLRYNPNAWGAHIALALLESTRGNHVQALAHARAAERLRPDLHESQNDLSVELVYSGDLDGALAHALEAHRLAPWDRGIWINCAVFLVQKQRYGEALEIYKAIAEASPDDAPAHCNWGVCLFYTGKMDEAIAQYRRALQIDPQYQDAQRNLDIALRARDPSIGAAERGFAH